MKREPITEREFVTLSNHLSSISETQTEILIGQNKCESRHVENEYIADSDRSNHQKLDLKISGYERKVLHFAIAILLISGSIGAGFYTYINKPPPAEPNKTQIKKVANQ